MRIADINPHLRFAQQITYNAERSVYVRDCRVFYIIDGHAKIILNDTMLNLNKNTLFYCCGGTNYTINTDRPLCLYALNFDLSQNCRGMIMPFVPQEYDGSSASRPVDKCDIADSVFLNSYLLLNNGTEFKNTVADIVSEFSTQKSYFREISGTKLKNLLVELHRTAGEKSVDSLDAVIKIINYIATSFDKKITNSELADIAGYHKYYLNRLFIKHTGVSMHKYLINMRINEGKRYLLNTNMSIADIAAKIGFNSNTHFATYFKNELNMTPTEYRNSFKNNI